jgi:hypothetical protein
MIKMLENYWKQLHCATIADDLWNRLEKKKKKKKV